VTATEPDVPCTLPEHALLTVAEVARVMRVSKMTVYRLVHAEELPAVRFGRSCAFPRRPCAPT
jgi:excisionase family DNA binding protein